MIICFEGQQGQGKTSSAIFVAMLFKQAFDKKLVSNATIKNAGIIKTIDEFRNLRNSIFLLDEAYQNFDSRKFAKNVDLTYEITQQRKRKNIFIYTAQVIEMVDNRLRENTNFVFRCRQDSSMQQWLIFDYVEYYYRGMVNSFPRSFPLSYFDKFGVYASFDTYEAIYALR